MARRIVLTSPLAPDAIARKMRKVLGGRTAKPARGVTGNGSEQTMTLFYFRPNIRNSFQTTLVATMEPADGGTRIEGKIGPPAGVFVFLGCWFGFLIVFLAMVVGGMAASGAPTEAIVPQGFQKGVQPDLFAEHALSFHHLLNAIVTHNVLED